MFEIYFCLISGATAGWFSSWFYFHGDSLRKSSHADFIKVKICRTAGGDIWAYLADNDEKPLSPYAASATIGSGHTIRQAVESLQKKLGVPAGSPWEVEHEFEKKF